ncbi:large ribosomal subunit protein eL14-like [Sycon ciliatum]|uniref:Large ribosomal subunit protein eL14 n=1 Tax=Sycon ciliatum TaxID=27933 RepID=M1XMS9_9METZ|nr:60S ribosomal protein L14 [Sycon ciliatum]|eukprot:scpid80539/ scgid12387/ 60S ribosomal protein L14
MLRATFLFHSFEKMVFQRFVEVGRLALVNTGDLEGKLCVIVDVIDQRRALVDGPTTGVPRQALNFNDMSLTDFKIALPPQARTRTVRRRMEKSDALDKWSKTSWAQKLHQRTTRKNLTDFERFKLKMLKQKRARIVRTAMKQIRKESA